MLDRILRPAADPLLDRLARILAAKAVRADQVTWAGFGLGIAAAASAAFGFYLLALLFFLANRLADGIDGSLARRDRPTDLGGFLDISLDFIVYSGLVFAMALSMPEEAFAACYLMFSFVGTGTSFLAFAIFAAKRGLSNPEVAGKGLYYMGGLAEGTETIMFFILVLLFPSLFSKMAYIFGALCFVTAAGRIGSAIAVLKDEKDEFR